MRTQTEPKSLLTNAFEVLLAHLGPEKTTQVWQILTSPYTDYLKIRPKLFTGKNISSLYKEAKKFNKV